MTRFAEQQTNQARKRKHTSCPRSESFTIERARERHSEEGAAASASRVLCRTSCPGDHLKRVNHLTHIVNSLRIVSAVVVVSRTNSIGSQFSSAAIFRRTFVRKSIPELITHIPRGQHCQDGCEKSALACQGSGRFRRIRTGPDDLGGLWLPPKPWLPHGVHCGAGYRGVSASTACVCIAHSKSAGSSVGAAHTSP